jgi:hypothetical protein
MRPAASRSSTSFPASGVPSVSARFASGTFGPAELVMLGNSVEP